MPNLIKNGEIVEDNWQLVGKPDTDAAPGLPAGRILLPLVVWQQQREVLRTRQGEVGVWLNSDETAGQLAEDARSLPLIAINFPTFMDGRGFSTARLLRERFRFEGELRAIGYVIRDQLFYLKRCGFNAFSLADGTDLNAALKSLGDFTETYQAAVDQPLPLFRRRTPAK